MDYINRKLDSDDGNRTDRCSSQLRSGCTSWWRWIELWSLRYDGRRGNQSTVKPNSIFRFDFLKSKKVDYINRKLDPDNVLKTYRCRSQLRSGWSSWWQSIDRWNLRYEAKHINPKYWIQIWLFDSILQDPKKLMLLSSKFDSDNVVKTAGYVSQLRSKYSPWCWSSDR